MHGSTIDNSSARGFYACPVTMPIPQFDIAAHSNCDFWFGHGLEKFEVEGVKRA